MSRHANPRVYVGPKTSELIVPLGRAFGVDPDVSEITIEFARRKIGALVISTWTSYNISDEKAHFEIPELFRTDIETFPKGFYDGVVKLDECIIGDIELIKAPGHYLSNADSVEGRCVDDNTWVEPDCADEEIVTCTCTCNGDEDADCDCIYQVKNNCPTCYNEVIIAGMDVSEEYIDWAEDAVCEEEVVE